MSYVCKGSVISYLKRMITKSKRDNKTKHIHITTEQAKEIMEELNPTVPKWNLKSNSLKAGAVILCIEPKELCERLNGEKPSVLMNKLAEARSKIKGLQNFGDVMFSALSFKDQETLAEDWVKIKKLYEEKK